MEEKHTHTICFIFSLSRSLSLFLSYPAACHEEYIWILLIDQDVSLSKKKEGEKENVAVGTQLWRGRHWIGLETELHIISH